eukprot:3128289-Pleurochrysis_carterae.AAC.2
MDRSVCCGTENAAQQELSMLRRCADVMQWPRESRSFLSKNLMRSAGCAPCSQRHDKMAGIRSCTQTSAGVAHQLFDKCADALGVLRALGRRRRLLLVLTEEERRHHARTREIKTERRAAAQHRERAKHSSSLEFAHQVNAGTYPIKPSLRRHYQFELNKFSHHYP